jgi:membrane protein
MNEEKKYFIDKVKEFFAETIWDQELDKSSVILRPFVELVRMLTFTFHKFVFDKSLVKASALTYYTLLSIVPLLALSLAIAKGFGLDQLLEEQLRRNVMTVGPSTEKIFEFARNMILHVKGGLFTGLGIALLIWAVIKGLGRIELSFNSIWEIKKQRSFGRKFSDYLSVMLLLPIFMIIVGSLNVFLGTGMKTLESEYSAIEMISPVLLNFLKTLPYVIIWILFIFLYIFIPNTKVKFKAAFISGLIAGTLFQLLQWGYIRFQIGVSAYNAIYGSLAALPLLLIWLQLSWSIVLWGAELSFYIQNRIKIGGLTEYVSNSIMSERILAIAVLHKIVDLFKNGDSAMSVYQLAKHLNLKYSDVKRSQEQLQECGLISEINKLGRKVYQPAFDIRLLTLAKVIDSLEKCGNNPEFEFPQMDQKFIEDFKAKYSYVINMEMNDILISDIK